MTLADPSAETIVETTLLAARAVRRFGLAPKIALLSHSNFGARNTPSAIKMRTALAEIMRRAPDLEVEGEMQADIALSAEIRQLMFPSSRLQGEANLLILPTVDAAHIAFNLVRALADGQSVGPILLGMAKPIHLVNQSADARALVNVAAIAVDDAQTSAETQSRSADLARALG